MEVANYAGTTSPHHPPFLNEEENWQLFSKNVFRGKDCPSDLELLGRSIAESCKGLPIAIVVLAGLVAKKEISQREWSRLKKITWHLTQDRIDAMDTLKLSYDNLPQRLKVKPRFLYFGIYPEHYEINAREVIQMWIAEGFIQPYEAGIPNVEEPEDIAEYYLDELVDRNLVQVASRKSNGSVKTCRIHDLLRDICILESKSDKFMNVCTELKNIDAVSNAAPRRLSCHCKTQPYNSSNNSNQLFSCSLFLFIREDDYPKDVIKSFKLVRVLYSRTKIGIFYSIPSDWKIMIHLRYLKIDAPVRNIPASVRNLWNLEMLDVKFIGMISIEIWKLKRLKHLYIRVGGTVADLPKLHRKIKGNLQTLWFSYNVKSMFSLLKNDIFPRLRKLVLSCFCTTFHGQLPSLRHLSNLHSLKITGIQLEPPSDANAYPSNITKLTLKWSHINSDFFSIIGRLTNLQILKLTQGSAGEFNLNFGAGEFPQLQVFQMTKLKVRSWTLEKGAMPRLRHLVIDGCEYLDELPEQLWCLTSPPQVHVLRPTSRLANCLRNVELKNNCKLMISAAP